MSSWTVVIVVGTRPQIIKCGVIQEDLRRHPSKRIHRLVYVDTGQHYDPELAALPREDLGVAFDRVLQSGPADQRNARYEIADGLDQVLGAERPPAAVLVVGDTRSTLAGGMAARRAGLPLIYMEAGLGARVPGYEESYVRQRVSALASVLVCWSDVEARQLREAGFTAAILVREDPHLEFVRRSVVAATEPVEQPFVLVTLHKAMSMRAAVVESVWAALAATRRPAVVLLTPGLRRVLQDAAPPPPNVTLRPERPPRATWQLMADASFLVTDSGTMPREAAALGKRSVLVREFSGNGQLIDAGIARMANPDPRSIASAMAWAESTRTPFTYGRASSCWHEIIDDALTLCQGASW
jgi:UDP-GlcNAc3NAcA epimerase